MSCGVRLPVMGSMATSVRGISAVNTNSDRPSLLHAAGSSALSESLCGDGRLAARGIQRDRAVGRTEGHALSVVRQGDLVGIAGDAFRRDRTRRAGVDFCDVRACRLSGLRADDEQAPHVAQPFGLHHRHGAGLDLSRFAGSERMNHEAWRRSMNDGEHRCAVGRELLRLSFADSRDDAVGEPAHVDVVVRTAAAAVEREQNAAAVAADVARERAVQHRDILRRPASERVDVSRPVVLGDERLAILGDVVRDQASRRGEHSPLLTSRS